MALTAQQFSDQMIAQIQLMDPSISCAIGTPERKIIDTVATTLADNQIDLTGLQGSADIDSKYGSNLDQFTSLFGMARQGATYATGYVVFERNSPAPAVINIPQGATIQSNTLTSQGQFLQYQTTVSGSIPQDATTSNAIPVQCVTAGSVGNAAINSLTVLTGVPIVAGVTSVTNPTPITGGNDAESDNAFKVRFKNTVFRNLAGVTDQYLALAVSTAYTTKATVIGPESKYQEYLQIPDVDDAGYLNGIRYSNGATLPNGSVIPISLTGGLQNQWTTSWSSIPYAQDIYTNIPNFISSGQTGLQYFFRPGVDFNFNYPPRPVGDVYRDFGGPPTITPLAPNFTFLNIFNPTDGSSPPEGVQVLAPMQVLLSEFSYMSSASRNSLAHNISNAVDIYVDGSNPVSASCVMTPGTPPVFNTNPSSPFYIENFRRDGEPAVRPHPGNFFTPLFQSPLLSLPETISVTVGSTIYNYYLGYHYWLVHEVDILEGSVRSRDGIEWSNVVNADTTGVGVPGAQPPIPYAPPLAPYTPDTNPPGFSVINTIPTTPVEIDNYQYDGNITVLQSTMEASAPIIQDPLVHSALNRYFKIDVTVVYVPSANPAVVNAAISTSLKAYYLNQGFNGVILLSDLLSIVQQTPGVANVRWSNDFPTVPTKIRVYETDINGYPLHTPWIDRISPGINEVQRLYVPGPAGFSPTDSFQLTWVDPSGTFTSLPILFGGITASTIQYAIQHGTGSAAQYEATTVATDSWASNPLYPLETFQLAYNTSFPVYLPSITNVSVTQSPYSYDDDFYLRDNELAALPTGMAPNDTVPGAIIRPRAQNTFFRPGIG